MSTELNTGADWEQSRRLVVHWHDMWSIQKRENELLKRKLEVARDGLVQIQSCSSRDEAFYKALRTLAEIERVLK